MTQKLTLALLNSRIDTLEANDIARTKIIVALQTQIANMGSVPVVPPCECNMVTCEECLQRAMGMTAHVPAMAIANATPAKTGSKAKTGSDELPSADADFHGVIIPALARRVIHNATHGVDCKTDKLTTNGTWYGVTDYRYNMTPSERTRLKVARDKQGVSAKDAIHALAGAVERLGGVK